MIYLDTPMKDFLDLIIKRGACSEGPVWTAGVVEGNKNISCKEAIGELFFSDKKTRYTWSLWVLTKIGGELDVEVRKLFIDRIECPVKAYKLYKRLDYLTTEEMELLKSKFVNAVETRGLA